MAKLMFSAAITLLLSALLADALKVTEMPCQASSSQADCTAKVSNSECGTDKCKCADGYGLADEETVCNLLVSEKACTSASGVLVCSLGAWYGCDASDNCKCSDKAELSNGNTECKLKAGQACTAATQCSSNKCEDNQCSGAPVAVTASIVLMLFTFLTSRFF